MCQFSCSVVSDSATPWTAAHQASLSITNSQSLLKLTNIELVMPSNHLTLCRPLLFLPSITPSIRVFPNESVLHIGATASASVLPVNIQDWFPLWLTGLISLQSKRPSSLLQYHNLKASILQHSAFFMVHLLHLYMSIGQTIALTIRTFVGKVISLPFNMLSRFFIASLARSKHLLISWLQSPSAVVLEPQK